MYQALMFNLNCQLDEIWRSLGDGFQASLWVSTLIGLTKVLRWKTDHCASHHFLGCTRRGEWVFKLWFFTADARSGAAFGSDHSRFLTRMDCNFKLWAKTESFSFKVHLSGCYLFYCWDRKHNWNKGIKRGCTMDITNAGIQKVNLTGMWLKYMRELIRGKK